MTTLEALLSENSRLAKALDAATRAQRQSDELSKEKVGHLERTVTELTRQSTNDAFAAARRLAELEREVEALRASGGPARAAAADGEIASLKELASEGTAKLEASYAALLSSLQDEWAQERVKLTQAAEREKANAAEVAARGAAERKRLVELMESRLSSLTRTVSEELVATTRRLNESEAAREAVEKSYAAYSADAASRVAKLEQRNTALDAQAQAQSTLAAVARSAASEAAAALATTQERDVTIAGLQRSLGAATERLQVLEARVTVLQDPGRWDKEKAVLLSQAQGAAAQLAEARAALRREQERSLTLEELAGVAAPPAVRPRGRSAERRQAAASAEAQATPQPTPAATPASTPVASRAASPTPSASYLAASLTSMLSSLGDPGFGSALFASAADALATATATAAAAVAPSAPAAGV